MSVSSRLSAHFSDSESCSGSSIDWEDQDPIPLFPCPGSYVVFSVDAVATLDGIEDPEVRDATLKMATNKYVAYVDQCLTFDVDAPWLEYRLVPLAQGPPLLDGNNGVEPDMCIPVLSNTEHPTSRKPLCPSRPLPWSNCYHHSHLPDINVRARSHRAEATEAITLSIEELVRYEDLKSGDRQKLKAVLALRDEESTETESSTSKLTEQVEALAPHNELAVQSDTLTMRPQPQENIDNLHEDVDIQEIDDPHVEVPEFTSWGIFNAIMVGTLPEENMTAVTMSYDLGALESVPDPCGFFKEESYLQSLLEDSKKRAIERAKQLDEEAYGPGPAERSLGYVLAGTKSDPADPPNPEIISSEPLAVPLTSQPDNPRESGDLTRPYSEPTRLPPTLRPESPAKPVDVPQLAVLTAEPLAPSFTSKPESPVGPANLPNPAPSSSELLAGSSTSQPVSFGPSDISRGLEQSEKGSQPSCLRPVFLRARGKITRLKNTFKSRAEWFLQKVRTSKQPLPSWPVAA